MRFLLRSLPSLIVLAVVALLAFAGPVPQNMTSATRDAEIHELEQKQAALGNRLEELRAERHHVVPRGGL